MVHFRARVSGLAVVIAVAGVCYVAPGCSSPFSGCEARRTCASPSAGAAGVDESEAGSPNGAASGEGGAAGAAGPTGEGGTGGLAGAGGEAGETSEPPACVTSDDCSNGAMCNGAGECACSPRFNGKHCEFQVFRGIVVLQGDTDSEAGNVSHDGTVVVGYSYLATQTGNLNHAVRSVNGAALQFIAEPAGLTPSKGCIAVAVDSSGTVLLQCESKTFVYTSAGGVVAVDLSPHDGIPNDISLDGKVIVGTTNATPQQEFRHANGTTSLLGVLEPGGTNLSTATNRDGSIVVGFDALNSEVATRWTAATGLTALSGLSDWKDFLANDVTPDGKVIVGLASTAAAASLAVKWSGAALKPTVLGPGTADAVSGDGSMVGGTDGTYKIATLWDGAGAHAVQELLGATPDLTADWSLVSVSGISDDGKVVVGGGMHGTHREGWVAHLP